MEDREIEVRQLTFNEEYGEWEAGGRAVRWDCELRWEAWLPTAGERGSLEKGRSFQGRTVDAPTAGSERWPAKGEKWEIRPVPGQMKSANGQEIEKLVYEEVFQGDPPFNQDVHRAIEREIARKERSETR